MTSHAEPPPIIGHRGAAGHAPENTLASVVRAHELGATWVEVDVKLTDDGMPVLFHDDTLDRTTDGHGALAACTLEELRGRDAGAWFGPEFAGEQIPTLAGLIVALTDLGMGLNLELKPCPGRAAETGRAVADMLVRTWPADLPAPVVSSFDPAALAAFGAAAPGIELAFLVHRLPPDWLAIATRLGAGALHCDVKFLKRHQVGEIIGAGFKVRCYTVNDGPQASRLFKWGVQSVISDYPDRMP